MDDIIQVNAARQGGDQCMVCVVVYSNARGLEIKRRNLLYANVPLCVDITLVKTCAAGLRQSS